MGRTLSPRETTLDLPVSRLQGSLSLTHCPLSLDAPTPVAPQASSPLPPLPPPSRPSSGKPAPTPRPEHVRKTDLLAALLYGGGVFAGVHALAILSITSLALYRSMGFRSALQDFDLPRFLALSFLPFGFNLAFGIFFGQKYWVYGRANRESPESLVPRSSSDSVFESSGGSEDRPEVPWPLYWVSNPWLWVFLSWLALFNLPRFFDDAPVLAALRNFSLPPWPPEHYYMPIRNEVFLYMAVGNRALFSGFLATVGWLWFSARIATQTAPAPMAPGDRVDGVDPVSKTGN